MASIYIILLNIRGSGGDSPQKPTTHCKNQIKDFVKFTMLLTLEFTTCPRAQKSESGQELLKHLDFLLGHRICLWISKNFIGVLQKGKKGL